MRNTQKLMLAFVACGLMAAGVSSAEAKGCLKGAAVGGLAGHMAGHGVLGAAGGCAVGHHMANRPAQDSQRQRNDQPVASNYDQSRR